LFGVSTRQSHYAERLYAERAEIVGSLDPIFGYRLLSMYRGEPQLGADGALHPIDVTVKMTTKEGMWLHDLCVSVRPETTLEVGMAYGFSTLYILAALAENQHGEHTAVDPFQVSTYLGIGLGHAQASIRGKGMAAAFQLVEERSDRAAIDFARAGRAFDVIFIDGNHRFDDVLVDFYLYAPLCTMGGHIVLHDTGMSSINTVANYLRTNRFDFEWVPTGVHNLGAFRKVGEDARASSHFRKFEVLPSAG
jgi:predicted O-methyltransferase YrrM